MQGTQQLLHRFGAHDYLLLQHHTPNLISRDDHFLHKVRLQIRNHIPNKDFGVKELAHSVHLSVSQLNRKLKNLIGMSSSRLIRETRLHYAADLLRLNTGSISEIAHQTGFSDQSQFCRNFKKLFVCTPSHFRKRETRPFSSRPTKTAG